MGAPALRVLIVHGRQDALVPLSNSEKLASVLGPGVCEVGATGFNCHQRRHRSDLQLTLVLSRLSRLSRLTRLSRLSRLSCSLTSCLGGHHGPLAPPGSSSFLRAGFLSFSPMFFSKAIHRSGVTFKLPTQSGTNCLPSDLVYHCYPARM